MIRETTGDILTAQVEALVNPVNTVGVMGAGLAKQFRLAYPEMFADYRVACDRRRLNIGRVMVHDVRDRPRYVISFPTKRHWRGASQLGWVDRGLIDLRRTIVALDIRSIAIPPLGCGLGGLHWVDVQELIDQQLGYLTDVDVVLYAPNVVTNPPQETVHG